MAKIWVLSDLHNETLALDFRPRMPNVEADLLIIAGDYDRADRSIKSARAQFSEIPLILVAGNHEHYRTGKAIPTNIERLKNDAQADRVEKGNMTYFLENETVILDVGSNIRVIGATLWTDFALFGTPAKSMDFAVEKMNDFAYIMSESSTQGELRPIDTVKLHCASRNFIEEQLKTPFNGKTIVVTHHLPSMRSVAAHYKANHLTPAFASDCDDLLALGADLWVHGHTHNSCDYVAGRTRVVCNPHGYYAGPAASFAENRQFDPGLVIEL